MSVKTKIQWCDSTVNPTMGCDGCEIWGSQRKTCYAGTLHVRFGGVTPGYAPRFEEVTLFPGRVAEACGWSDLAGKARADKPWLDGLPRLIFVSDMSDSLSAAVPFEFLRDEIVLNVAGERGRRHRWLWLTKRPDRMAKFSRWLEDGRHRLAREPLGRDQRHLAGDHEPHQAPRPGRRRADGPVPLRRAPGRGDRPRGVAPAGSTG